MLFIKPFTIVVKSLDQSKSLKSSEWEIQGFLQQAQKNKSNTLSMFLMRESHYDMM